MPRRPFPGDPRGDERLMRELPALLREHRPELMEGEKLYRAPPGFTSWSGHWSKAVAVELSAEGGEQLFIPAGFAHGFCTLVPDSGLAYKVDAYYSAAHDRGVRWNDPALGIAWPVAEGDAVLSAKDKVQPVFADLTDLFD